MQIKRTIGSVLSSALRYGKRERERILWLLPLLVVLGLLFGRRAPEPSDEVMLRYTDRVVDSLRQERTAYRTSSRTTHTDHYTPYNASESEDEGRSALSQERDSSRTSSYTLFRFDPNEVTHSELCKLGFTAKQAQVILNYREAGARFRTPADFARCYTVSEQKYEELLPYIEIAPQHREVVADTTLHTPSHTTTTEPAATDTAAASLPSVGEGLQSQAPSDPAPRTAWRSEQEIERERTKVLVEINSADSATLDGIYGVGALTAQRIIAYREALGGFARKEQVAELRGMTDQNYQRILTQIWVDSSLIQKIDVNFATPSELNAHPYVDERTTDRIMKQRQLKGGWRTIQELKEQHIITQEQAIHLAPYFRFSEP